VSIENKIGEYKMPRDVMTTVYKFEELSESAKERARDWWRDGMEFSWSDESRESIEAFCAQFGIHLKDWSVGPYQGFYWRAEFDNSNFRGMKLRDFEREKYPTGYCLDATLSITFYDVFKKTGDAKFAFDCAMDEGFKDWRDDMERQLGDDYIDDCLIANEYEFTESGKVV
jgi:hypothetical protein